jgi:hypothetical protein
MMPMDTLKLTPAKARRLAIVNRNEQRRCNREARQEAIHEHAYSPSTCAIGIRPADWSEFVPPREKFRVHNVFYPRYRDDDGVGDWQSVGTDCPRGNGPRR